ncbi:MAG: DctP family TRAP transporter solute-binding subunit [Acidaminococcaceae bacterium]|nr:DctP family TRAP transporter solute-binding subunit [Acidaminococcaceae bacterium]MDD4721496.1 DctP family TRAP transporter solute-binding subunit [Acidaminococcaceae bacterium]
MTMGSKMLKKMIAVTMVCAMAITLGCGGGNSSKSTSAKESDKVTLKLAHNLPASHPLAKGAATFAKKVQEKSMGNITITIYPSGQLYNDKSMNDAIMAGGIDMGLNTVGRWSSVIPAMEVFDVPFLFPSYAQVDKAIDGGLGAKLGAELLKKGVRSLIWADYGFVQFANAKHAITKPEDFAGLKLRGYGEMPSDTIKALGAAPVTMGSGEVYMAIQRGVVDGLTSGTTAMFDRKIYEVAKYLTITNHAYPEFILAMNEKSFQKLSPAQQKIITEAAKEVRDELRKNAQTEDTVALEKLKAKGMEVYVVPANEIGQWQQATKPCWDTFVKHSGKLGQELIDICTKK